MLKGGGNILILQNTSINNLLLLPKSVRVGEEHTSLVIEILDSHKVFKQLFELEQGIQPILASLEEKGIVVSKKWLEKGVEEKTTQSKELVDEINHYINGVGKGVNQNLLNEFWKKNDLPIARTFEELSTYKRLHPTYQLMLQHKKQARFLKQWGSSNLIHKGTQLANGDVKITGRWQSFASYTGRISAKQLPLTSLPSAMRDYIVPPKDFQIVSIDLNNAELRFLAYYAKCDRLIQRFNDGKDIHYETAKLIRNQMNHHEVDDEQARELAKRYTYSFLYGAGVKIIQKSLQKVFNDITSANVATINEAFTQQYPEIQSFLLQREKSENLLTAFGELKSIATFYEAQRRNFTLQSSVSVAIKMLMKTLANHQIEIMHVLHDEVWISTPTETSLETLMAEVSLEFKEKIKNTFRGFPNEGLLTIEKIGGKYNE